MSDYRHGSHTTFSIHLHIVWITKYRHKVWRGEVAERVRAIVREECQKARVDIMQGHISLDHVHVMLSLPPHVTISRLIQRMKGVLWYFPGCKNNVLSTGYVNLSMLQPSERRVQRCARPLRFHSTSPM
jgi:Transposase IS200 like